jgi:hypothetical protein
VVHESVEGSEFFIQACSPAQGRGQILSRFLDDHNVSPPGNRQAVNFFAMQLFIFPMTFSRAYGVFMNFLNVFSAVSSVLRFFLKGRRGFSHLNPSRQLKRFSPSETSTFDYTATLEHMI